jgi:hypothetical protein
LTAWPRVVDRTFILTAHHTGQQKSIAITPAKD